MHFAVKICFLIIISFYIYIRLYAFQRLNLSFSFSQSKELKTYTKYATTIILQPLIDFLFHLSKLKKKNNYFNHCADIFCNNNNISNLHVYHPSTLRIYGWRTFSYLSHFTSQNERRIFNKGRNLKIYNFDIYMPQDGSTVFLTLVHRYIRIYRLSEGWLLIEMSWLRPKGQL